jgi:hypothetical protein
VLVVDVIVSDRVRAAGLKVSSKEAMVNQVRARVRSALTAEASCMNDCELICSPDAIHTLRSNRCRGKHGVMHGDGIMSSRVFAWR